MQLDIKETFTKKNVNWSSSDFIVAVFNFGKYPWGNVLHVNWHNVLQCNTLPVCFMPCLSLTCWLILTESYKQIIKYKVFFFTLLSV